MLAQKAKTISGHIFAPLIFQLGRLTKSGFLKKASRSMDPFYLNALRGPEKNETINRQISRFHMAGALSGVVSADHGSLIVDLLPLSRSQFLQDIFCILALDGQRNGFFVEVGVGSGERISNTFMLEKEFGWSGLLFEPNRSFHEGIAKSREAQLDTRAASEKSGDIIVFREFTEAGEHSTVSGAKAHNTAGWKFEEYDVETVALNDAFLEKGAPKEIDFISIDTEGTEVSILRGINFHEYSFKVMVIEHNHNRTALTEYDSILLPHGYRRVLPELSGADAWYVHSSVPMNAFQQA
jgi:FkbM family methyltransferase